MYEYVCIYIYTIYELGYFARRMKITIKFRNASVFVFFYVEIVGKFTRKIKKNLVNCRKICIKGKIEINTKKEQGTHMSAVY